MTAFFSEKAVRVTPAGVLRGREAKLGDGKQYHGY
jgi:hypothetical protein